MSMNALRLPTTHPIPADSVPASQSTGDIRCIGAPGYAEKRRGSRFGDVLGTKLYDNDGDLTARVIAITAPDRANSHPHRNQYPHPRFLSSA
jgi:hypothetical protein